MPLLQSVLDKLVVRACRNDAFESRRLREHFRKSYDISVGLYTSIGAFDRWRIPPGSRIGRYCSISASARLIDANHPVSALSTHPYFYLARYGLTPADRLDLRPPAIEDDVWLGHNCIVLPTCQRIGRGAVVGAGSVVIEDVPPYAMVMGDPARVIRYRFSPEVIAAIEATEWWLLDREELLRAGRSAPDFLTAPTVENAKAFARALGRELVISPAPARTARAAAKSEVGGQGRSATQRRLLGLVQDLLPAFTEQDTARSFIDLGLDSLRFINLRLAVEDVLGRRIDERAWAEISNADDLLELAPATDAPESPPAKAAPPAGGASDLYWLPPLDGDFRTALGAILEAPTWAGLVALAKHRLAPLEIDRLDSELQRLSGALPDRPAKTVKVAILSSCTVEHLAPAIRVGLLRRGTAAEVYCCTYGQYFQELSDPRSGLFRFKPDVVLFSMDAPHLLAGAQLNFDRATADAFLDAAAARLETVWKLARDAFGCQVIQQTALPTAPALIGNNEHRLPGSPAQLTARLNLLLQERADAAGVDLLDLDAPGCGRRVANGYDPGLWHAGKQEIAPTSAPLYGELAARLIAAQRGLSYKCVVLDLDNTLWGGVIGDDGLEGIRLGQGSREGEAYLALQTYLRDLSHRGVILAVCSKNEEANALLPFEQHPEMLLKRSDVACFVANWNDKAGNLRAIAETLNIGLDSLVFVDDNPFERNIVRRELPMVAVPELPDDPALYRACLVDAGCFESVRLTKEDFQRGEQYQEIAQRAAFRESHTDIESYLSSLGMELQWSRFDKLNLARVTQLINKTNQFNLTTRRYTEQQVLEVMADPQAIGLKFRLLDRFGDNGIIGVLIGRMGEDQAIAIDTWLMSCRVFGRRVENAMLEILIEEARKAGAGSVVGEYIPTAKNGIVAELFDSCGFSRLGGDDAGRTTWRLALDSPRSVQPFPGAVVGESAGDAAPVAEETAESLA